MLTEDYLLRLLRPFLVAIGQILSFKKQRDTKAALIAINDAGEKLLGLNSSLMNLLSERYMLELLEKDSDFGALRCLVLARLLKEEADVVAIQGDEDGAIRRYLKSLNIYLEVLFTRLNAELQNDLETIEDISDRLKGFNIPIDTNQRLYRYFEKNRRYGRAEDVLFDMIDASPDHPGLIEDGIDFYRRLLTKHPQDLSTGNLPVDEVQAGLSELLTIQEAGATND